MSDDALASTLQPPAAEGPARCDVRRAPFLTVLHHPRVERVGERAALGDPLPDGPVRLSRLEPAFFAPGGAGGRPLEDRHLSRTPLVFSRAGESLRLAVPAGVAVLADGQSAPPQRVWRPDELERGVVLELAGRVVLLLHLRAAPGAAAGTRWGLVGESEAMEQLRADIGRVADLPVPVLVRGESGSGKELVARALHDSGPRARGPFVATSLAAVPASTAASELFGHVAGAFTGAARDHPGYFAEADGGTLFLDEVGALPLDVQAMLLRALETGEIRPLGARSARRVDVRLVSATDAELEQGIAAGTFREPLFFRLAGYQLRVPPLRERREDLGRLLQHFLARELAALGASLPAGDEPWLPAPVVTRLAQYGWPGNVRQLRNVARQLVISSRGLAAARIDATVAALLQAPPASAPVAPAAARPGPRRVAERLGDDELLAALRANGWRMSATAEQLGISKTTLYALVDKSDRIRKAKDVPREELLRAHAECGGDVDRMAALLEVSRHGLKLRLADEKLS